MSLSPASGSRFTLPKHLRLTLKPLIDKAAAVERPLYLVGESVRALLSGDAPTQFEMAVEGSADSVARAAARDLKARRESRPGQLSHRLVLRDGSTMELASTRTETFSEPAAVPIVEPGSLQEDLFRRDFSVNAMAISLNAADFGLLWDPFGGAEDLQAKRLRVLHDAAFRDDPARIFRAARLASQLKLTLEWRTRDWLSEAVAERLVSKLSPARLLEEWTCLLADKEPMTAVRLLCDWGVLETFCRSFRWSKAHDALLQIAAQAKGDERLALSVSALLHALPAETAVFLASRFGFSPEITGGVEDTLRTIHEKRGGAAVKGRRSAAARRFIERAATHRRTAGGVALADPELKSTCTCLSNRDLRGLGYRPGPLFKQMVYAIREARWEGKLRTREEEVRFLEQTFPQGKQH